MSVLCLRLLPRNVIRPCPQDRTTRLPPLSHFTSNTEKGPNPSFTVLRMDRFIVTDMGSYFRGGIDR